VNFLTACASGVDGREEFAIHLATAGRVKAGRVV